MGAVINFRAVRLRQERNAIEKDAIQRRLIASDLRTMAGNLDTMGTIVADMEASLVLVSDMLRGYVDDLRVGNRRRRRIMRTIEAIEATMHFENPAQGPSQPL